MAAPYADTSLELLRGPLTGYCYRMLGAAGEVDDAVQETLLRAHRDLDRHDPGRASLSTWVHGIATHICLDLLRGTRRRALPWGLGPAATSGELGAPLPAAQWIEPLADSRLPQVADPAELAERRESVRLAFVAALQWLPPRARPEHSATTSSTASTSPNRWAFLRPRPSASRPSSRTSTAARSGSSASTSPA